MDELGRAACLGDCFFTRGSKLLSEITMAELCRNEKAMAESLAVVRKAVDEWDWKLFEEITAQMKEFARICKAGRLPRSRRLIETSASYISMCEGKRHPAIAIFFADHPILMKALQRAPHSPSPDEVFQFLISIVDETVSRAMVTDIMALFKRAGRRGRPRKTGIKIP